jgi:hypothetical protein
MKPYTYFIRHRPTNRVYYGVRTANNVPAEDDLWHTYFTSSPTVKRLIEEYGADSFDVEVRREFDTVKQAIAWETSVLRRMRVLENEEWINANVAGYIVLNEASRKKISEYHQGKPKSEEHRAKIAAAITGIKREPRSEEYRNKMSEIKKGAGNAMYGRKHSAETLAKISSARKGQLGHTAWNKGIATSEETKEKMRGRKDSPEVVARRSATMKAKKMKRERVVCEHCFKEIPVNIFARYHGDRCKSRK